MNAYQLNNQVSACMFSNYMNGAGISVSYNYPYFSVNVGSDNYLFFAGILNDNTCHQLAIVRAGVSVSAYADGILKGTVTHGSVANVGISTSPIMIGRNNFADMDFGGFIHEIRFWNSARSQSNIQSAMNVMLVGNETGLIGYWKCNDGFGQTVNDFSINNNDGQLGSTLSADLQDPAFISGCSNCSPPSSGTITAGGPTTFCQGGSVVLSAPPGYTYYWSSGFLPDPLNNLYQSYTATYPGNFNCKIGNNCGNILSNTIPVIVNSAPSAFITASGPTTFCGPGAVTLNANTGTGLSYQWRFNSIAISGATSSSYPAAASGSYDCVISSTCGSANSNLITVTINNPPPAALIAGGPTTFCSPGSVTLNANTGIGLSYQWRLNNVNIPGATSASYIATAAGNYDCTVSNSCGGVLSNSIIVTVNTTPPASISASGSTTFCSPGSVTLNANTGTGLSYQWRLNTANISGATSASYIASAAGTYDCTVSNICGSALSNSISVIVNVAPPASVTAAGPTTFCSPGSVTLNANTGTGLSYQWRLNSVNISGATSASYVATSGGNYDCTVTNSCGSTTSNTIAVIVNSLPPASIIANGPTAFCTGGSVSLSANTGTGLSYQWKLNGGNISGATVSSYTALTAGTYSCSVSNSCGSTVSNSINVTVNIVPSAPGIISGQSTGVCSSTKTYSISPVANATSYTWAAPPGASISSGQGTTSVNITFTNAFNGGTISVVAVNACGSSGVSGLAVSGAPAQPGPISGPVSVCHNQNNVTYSVAAVTSATSYTWTVPSGAQIKTGQGTRTIKVRFGNSAGNITVRASNSCGSGTLSTLSVVMPCRDADEAPLPLFDVSVYPNPAVNQFIFVVDATESDVYSINIVDITGRTVESHQHISINTPFSCGEKLSDGLYIAEIISGTSRKVVKLFKGR